VHAPRKLTPLYHFMSTSTSRIKSKEVKTWNDIIQYSIQHNFEAHPSYRKYLTCELCYPVGNILDNTWPQFFDWYKLYFNTTNSSSETDRRYFRYKKAILKLIEDINNADLREEAFQSTYQLIGSIQYSFSPNYSIEDTGVILIEIGIATKGFEDIDNIVNIFKDIRDELRKQGKTLYQKPQSPFPPATIEISLNTPKPKTKTTPFGLPSLLNIGKKEQPSSTPVAGSSRYKPTILRSGITLNPTETSIADELAGLISDLRELKDQKEELAEKLENFPTTTLQSSEHSSPILEADQGAILDSPPTLSDDEFQDTYTNQEESTENSEGTESENENSFFGDILIELDQPSSSRGQRLDQRNHQLNLHTDRRLITEPIDSSNVGYYRQHNFTDSTLYRQRYRDDSDIGYKPTFNNRERRRNLQTNDLSILYPNLDRLTEADFSFHTLETLHRVIPLRPLTTVPPINQNLNMAYQLTQAEVTAMLQNMTNITNILGGSRSAKEQSIVKVQNFYGENEDPYEWFDEFMKAVEANNWPDGARRYHLTAAHLKGAAKQWYDEQLAAVTFGNAF